MDMGKKSMDLLTWAASNVVQLMDAPSAEKIYLAPKFQAPLAEPLPSTTAPAEPTPQFRYLAPIKSKLNVSDVISQVLSRKVCLLIKELLAIAPKAEGTSKRP